METMYSSLCANTCFAQNVVKKGTFAIYVKENQKIFPLDYNKITKYDLYIFIEEYMTK